MLPTSRFFFCLTAVLLLCCQLAQAQTAPRERLPMDQDWRFTLGHASDPSQDFGHGQGYFSYLAKAGYGEGAASFDFDDRGWRKVTLPHDWAMELPFDAKASHSHGYRALGPRFPQNSVGWYRHHFFIPASDLGRRLRIEFDGIQRQSRVFVNGFLVGEEMFGNLSQSYDITPYLNYGADNVVAVRADVSTESGWYYEGAGINRHAYLLKTAPIHVAENGTFVRSDIDGNRAEIRVSTRIVNERENTAIAVAKAAAVKRTQIVFDAQGREVARKRARSTKIGNGQSLELEDRIKIRNAQLWSPSNPYLYTLVTELRDGDGTLLDRYRTPFGLRSIRFDPDNGFFLNGERLVLKGTNNHEDHAGVGTATPDALIEFRLRRLKTMGMNAYRGSHAPISPALLDLADRLGILVIDENRLMGVNALHLDAVHRMIQRDRNHPSVILWSLGNEEWAIEGNPKGARIAKTMQSYARQWDPTRLNTVAISGGWGGISREIGVAGVNYIKQANTDKQHADFPWQVMLGTEETTTQQTRGIYFENAAKAHLPPLEDGSSGGNVESGWQYYAARPYLAGLFYWTGFDYRGEEVPYEYPAISSQFGILDTCGFAKDSYYYLRAWWRDEPLIHITPHWNWSGRENQPMDVRVYSNADEVELFFNDQSLGRKSMPRNGHLSWTLNYAPGELRALGYSEGAPTIEDRVATSGPGTQIQLRADRQHLRADDRDVAVVEVAVLDSEGRPVPLANQLIHFALEGPGRILGVGNGDPSSHEADHLIETVRNLALGDWHAPDAGAEPAPITFVARFDKPTLGASDTVSLLLNALGSKQSAFLNGRALYREQTPDQARASIELKPSDLKAHGNELRIEAEAYNEWGQRNKLHDLQPAVLHLVTPAPPYSRSVFNGLAQVIVQSSATAGVIKLHASAEGLSPQVLEIKTEAAPE